MKDNVCAIVVYRGHVNLMFVRGTDLDDPRGLLEDSGRTIRHVKMRAPKDVDRPGVRALITEARKRPDLGTPARPLKKMMTIKAAAVLAGVEPYAVFVSISGRTGSV